MKNRRMSLERVFRPDSVAVIGASDRGDKPGSRLPVLLRDFGFQGDLFAVNPRKLALSGFTSVRGIEQLPRGIDVACVALGAADAVESIGRLTAHGVGGAIVFASGFGESGALGAEREAHLAELAFQHCFPICGPNTAGLINLERRFIGSFTHALADGLPPSGSLMVITQSGAIGGVMLTHLRDFGIGVSHWVSVGNGAVIGLSQYLHYAAEDDGTSAVAIFVEGVKDGPAFRESVEACRRADKLVIALKAGTTDVGAQAARSHTGNIAGSNQVYDAVFRQHGIMRATSIAEFRDIAMAATRLPDLSAGLKPALVSVAGAGCTILADECSSRGIDLPALSAQTVGRLAELLPSYAQHRNPIDLTGVALEDLDILRRVIGLLQRDANIDSIFLGFATNIRADIAEAVVEAWDKSTSLAVILPVSHLAGTDMRVVLARAGIPCFESYSAAVGSLKHVLLDGVIQAPAIRSESQDADGEMGTQPAEGRWLTWTEARVLLQGAGISVVPSHIVKSPSDAIASAENLGCDRFVVKMEHGSLLHKTDVGGVRVGLERHELDVACAELMVQAEAVGLSTEGLQFLIQQHVDDAAEVLIGITLDSTFGPTVTVGMGGVFVETLDESASLVPPYDAADARAAIGSSRLGRFLEHHRQGPRDNDALVQCILKVQELVSSPWGIIEGDLNPVMVGPSGEGCLVVDARFRVRSGGGAPDLVQ